MEGAPYVRLRLTDNGIGYSDDALKKLESRSEIFERYHVGIQNLCRRMDILYKDKYRVAFFNNPTGGASSVIYLPIGEKQRTLLISEDNHECTDC